MFIALIGKPNSGKTAFFNQLTGSRQKVANYPGVTVERKEGQFSLNGKTYTVMDLPGVYSLDARSPDEVISRDVILGRIPNIQKLELLVCVVDATQLQVNLRLALELKQLGIPVMIALNMVDLAHKQGYQFDYEKLSAEIGLPVIPVIAIRKKGVQPFLKWLETYQPSLSIQKPGWNPLTSECLRSLYLNAKRITHLATIQKGSHSKVTQAVDNWILNPWLGIAILLTLLFIVFQAVFNLASFPMDMIDACVTALHQWLSRILPNGLFKSLILDGVLAGVGSVVIFLPQILILFFFILLLEDTGYMARAAFLLDKLMGGVGLHGKAFIPLLSSFACAIPGIMATRTIDNKRARFTTIMVAPLMTCSARLPVYTLIIAAFVPRQMIWGSVQLQGLVLFGLYALGILSALGVTWVLKGFSKHKTKEPFLMELPTYKWPSVKNLILGLVERARIFLKRAGTVIFALVVLLWFLSTFPAVPEGAVRPAIYYSYAGQLGQLLEPIFSPIGFNWQMVVALIPGMAAREVAIATLGTVYALSNLGDGAINSLTSILASQWTLASALAFLVWYVFAPQCVATLGVVKRETNSWIWPAVMLVYLMALAYGASFLTYRIASYVF